MSKSEVLKKASLSPLSIPLFSNLNKRMSTELNAITGLIVVEHHQKNTVIRFFLYPFVILEEYWIRAIIVYL